MGKKCVGGVEIEVMRNGEKVRGYEWQAANLSRLWFQASQQCNVNLNSFTRLIAPKSHIKNVFRHCFMKAREPCTLKDKYFKDGKWIPPCRILHFPFKDLLFSICAFYFLVILPLLCTLTRWWQQWPFSACLLSCNMRNHEFFTWHDPVLSNHLTGHLSVKNSQVTIMFLSPVSTRETRYIPTIH